MSESIPVWDPKHTQTSWIATTFWTCAFTWFTPVMVPVISHEAGRALQYTFSTVHLPVLIMMFIASLVHIPTLVLCNASSVPKLKFIKNVFKKINLNKSFANIKPSSFFVHCNNNTSLPPAYVVRREVMFSLRTPFRSRGGGGRGKYPLSSQQGWGTPSSWHRVPPSGQGTPNLVDRGTSLVSWMGVPPSGQWGVNPSRSGWGYPLVGQMGGYPHRQDVGTPHQDCPHWLNVRV